MSDTRPLTVGGAPYKTPNVRRKLPAPFSRARIDLDGGSRVHRDWKDTPVIDIKRGDTVAGFGTVDKVGEVIQIDNADGRYPWLVRLHNVMGDHRDYPGEQRVFAFTADG